MSLEASPLAAAVPGLVRSDPHGPGMTRVRDEGGFAISTRLARR